MKRVIAAVASLMLLLAFSSCVPPTGPAAQPRRELPGIGPPAAALEAQYRAKLDALLPGIAADSLVDREKPQQELEELCFQVGRPGAEAERAALCKAMVARLGPDTPRPARIWLLRQLERISGAESVVKLSALLVDPDPQIREHARLALQNNPAPAAAEALRAALDDTADPAVRVALINALAARRDQLSIPRFVYRAQAEQPQVATAAIAALGELGGSEATETLYGLFGSENEARRQHAAAALLRIADRLLERNERAPAGKIYGDLYGGSTEPPTRIAALRGLTATEQDQTIPLLRRVVRGQQDAEFSFEAVRLLGELPGPAATRILADELPELWPETQAVVLDVLGARGDTAVKPVVHEALSSESEPVRIAALGALQQLGGAEDLIRLASVAAETTGAEHAAARRSLARLRGSDIDPAILALVRVEPGATGAAVRAVGAAPVGRGGEGAAARAEVAAISAANVPGNVIDATVRAELIRCLADRYYKPAIPTLFDTARDSNEVVRQASFESLGQLGTQRELPRLVALLVAEGAGTPREAAENAVATVALKLADREQRAGPVLAALDRASLPARASLLRVLGRLQGAGALAAVRAAIHDENEDVADAAVRALSGWEEAVVLDDLLPLARQAPKETHRVLALRGYVRLLRLPSERPAEQTFALLEEAMSLATRDDERKQVLGALADVVHVDALNMAKSYLDHEALRDEAASAAITIASALAAEDRQIAAAALDEVLAAPASDAVRKRATEAQEMIKRQAGFITKWRYAGPFAQEGMNYDAVFGEAFPPETPDAPGVTWQNLAPTNREKPWMFDLTKVGQGADRCVYVRTTVWCEREQPARLEIGSDDGLKVWLNGQLVHANPAHRGLTPGEDKLDVTLHAGANPLLLKVMQAGGGWAFCCELKAPDGQPLKGLRFKAE